MHSDNRDVFIRNLVFGIEDGIVSTVGLLSGIAIAGVSGATIFLTGMVLILVEAFSMAAGSYLSEESVEENTNAAAVPMRVSITGAAIMFCSYVLAGFLPLVPYLLLDVGRAFTTSIVAAFISLFALGLWSGKRGKHVFKSAWRMATVGGAAILVGALVGAFAGR